MARRSRSTRSGLLTLALGRPGGEIVVKIGEGDGIWRGMRFLRWVPPYLCSENALKAGNADRSLHFRVFYGDRAICDGVPSVLPSRCSWALFAPSLSVPFSSFQRCLKWISSRAWCCVLSQAWSLRLPPRGYPLSARCRLQRPQPRRVPGVPREWAPRDVCRRN